MRQLCSGVEAQGTARLEHHQYFIATAVFASDAPKRGHVVHGVLSKIKAPHLTRLDTCESVESSFFYRGAAVPVHYGDKLLRVLAYHARDAAESPLSAGRRRGSMRMEATIGLWAGP